MKNRTISACMVLAMMAPGCSTAEPSASFAATLPPAPPPAPMIPTGGIFSADTGYGALHLGNRARAVGDPLTIILVETVQSSKSAGSKTDRSGGFSITPPTSGPLGFLNPNALNASGQSSFKGQGNASQSSSLAGEISVTIAEIRSNGTALVKGEKNLMLSQGREWVQFSGIVRLSDLDPDNRIASTRVADARMVYSGKGSIQKASREGWLSRFFNMISPF